MVDHILLSIKKLLIGRVLRNVHFGDQYERMEKLYCFSDPWNMSSRREQVRFIETNKIIKNNFNELTSILEIGCGEGHQSLHLSQLCDQLTGIDVSKKAIDRARKRVVQGHFKVSTLEEFHTDHVGLSFSLVTAMEVLYYISDIMSYIELMEQVGQTCFVTYYDKHADYLDSFIFSRPKVQHHEFSYKDTKWMVRWWNSSL